MNLPHDYQHLSYYQRLLWTKVVLGAKAPIKIVWLSLGTLLYILIIAQVTRYIFNRQETGQLVAGLFGLIGGYYVFPRICDQIDLIREAKEARKEILP